MAAQLAIEIEHVTVRIALPEYRDESEDPGLKRERFAIGRNQPLTGQLGGAVKRGLYREWRILGGREDPRFAVNRAARGKGNFPHAGKSHRLEQVVRGKGVLLEVPPRPRGAEAHIRIGGQMKHEIGAPYGSCQCVAIEQISLDEAEPGVLQRFGQEAALPARQVVKADHPFPTRQQPVDDVTADESCATGDEYCAHRFLITMRKWSPML